MTAIREHPGAFSDNPYAAPQCPSASTRPTPGGSSALRASLTVGLHEVHQVDIFMSIWTGIELYLVDAREQLRTHAWWGTRRFNVGQSEVHCVEVRVSPFCSVQVLVDGQVVVADAFPRIRRFHYMAVPLFLLSLPVLLTVVGLLLGEIILIFNILFPGGR
ncbi:MAG: hypothetical protein HY000_11980 [Planctomycetes bacterium]|nr:hypothetical protein [Planctomycetota bacterium]